MNKLSRYQATLQLMNLIKQPKNVCEAMLPNLEILTLDDVEYAAQMFRIGASKTYVVIYTPENEISCETHNREDAEKFLREANEEATIPGINDHEPPYRLEVRNA